MIQKTSLKENLGHRGGPSVRVPDPTPLAIRIACKRLQKLWSDAERHERSRYYQGR